MRAIDCDVVIVGGAVAGGFLACNLRGTGLKTVVVERNTKILELNRGDQLAPCTVRMLAALGALPHFEKRGSMRLTQWRSLGPDGETVNFVPLEATSPPPHNYILGLRHALIHEALLETATDSGTVEVIRGLRADGLVKSSTGLVTGITGTKDGERYQINARLVAGCDGPSSLVRREAGIETKIELYPFEYLMLTCTRHPEQPPDLMLEVWGAEGFGGFFPIASGRVRCPVQAERGESLRWREIGLKKVHAELCERFVYYADMEILDEDLHIYKIESHHAETYVADGVVIMGDAAHCTLPFYGMGMNIGMRDGYHAAKLIADVLQHGHTPTRAALLPYEQICRTFNDFVINASQCYGAVAAAKHKTTTQVRKALESSPTLNAKILSTIYADYEAAPPEISDPVAVAKQ